MNTLDPTGKVPLNDRILIGLGGRVIIKPDYRDYYKKAFAKAGLNIENYVKNKETFVRGLRVLNQLKFEALEAEESQHLASIDAITREYVQAVQSKNLEKTNQAFQILERRKAFKVI